MKKQQEGEWAACNSPLDVTFQPEEEMRFPV